MRLFFSSPFPEYNREKGGKRGEQILELPGILPVAIADYDMHLYKHLNRYLKAKWRHTSGVDEEDLLRYSITTWTLNIECLELIRLN